MEKRWLKEFPSLKGKQYLANCSRGPQSQGVIRAFDRYFESWAERASPYNEWESELNESASIFARLIGATRKEVAHSFSVSTAVDTLLSCFNYRSRKEIITSEVDFPTISVIMLAQRYRAARVKMIREKDGLVNISEMKRSVSEKTLLVNVPYVNSRTGILQDTAELVELSHAKGAFVLADAYQFVGTGKIDVKKEDIDFLVCGTLKYLLGTPGCAFLYVSKSAIESLNPTSTGWLSQKIPSVFGPRHLNYRTDASRFETGTWAIPSVYAATAGMKIVHNAGISSISNKLYKLNDYTMNLADDYGLPLATPTRRTRSGPFVSILFRNPQRLQSHLSKSNIFVSARNDVLRIAPHFFNDREDIDIAIGAINRAMRDR